MGKNIVICLDGTGNQSGKKKSNVVHLFRMLVRKPGEQIAFYDPGVGTMGDTTYKTSIARKINKALGLAFGRGLRKNLIEAYTYLAEELLALRSRRRNLSQNYRGAEARDHGVRQAEAIVRAGLVAFGIREDDLPGLKKSAVEKALTVLGKTGPPKNNFA